MLMRLIPAAAITAFCSATLWQVVAPPTPKLIYNSTNSAPIGWYAVGDKRALQRGDLVAAFAPEKARKLAHERGYLPDHIPLIKTVWATGGERVCHEGERVRVPNRPDMAVLAQDGLGRALPVMSGCYTLNVDEVFLISTDVQTSWDSRYFGPVRITDVLGRVRYIGERLGTGGRGGQDKRREAHKRAIPLSAHHVWGAYCDRPEAPQLAAARDAIACCGGPPVTEHTRKPPGNTL